MTFFRKNSIDLAGGQITVNADTGSIKRARTRLIDLRWAHNYHSNLPRSLKNKRKVQQLADAIQKYQAALEDIQVTLDGGDSDMPNWTFYDNFKLRQFNGSGIDFDLGDVGILLLDDSHTIVQATHDFVNDVSVDEVTGTNYARKTLTTPTVTLAAGTVKFDADDPGDYLEHASGFANARHAILYEDVTGTDAVKPLVAYATFAANVGNIAGNLSLQFDASNGIFTV